MNCVSPYDRVSVLYLMEGFAPGGAERRFLTMASSLDPRCFQVRVATLQLGGPLEAAVRELRLIQSLQPRFNRQAKTWRTYTYVKLTAERFPRLTVTRAARDDGSSYVGPLPSGRAAALVREAIETALAAFEEAVGPLA